MSNWKHYSEIRQDGLTKMTDNMSSGKQSSKCDGSDSPNKFLKKS